LCSSSRGDGNIPRIVKRIEMTTYITRGAPFFFGRPLLGTPKLRVATVEKPEDG